MSNIIEFPDETEDFPNHVTLSRELYAIARSAAPDVMEEMGLDWDTALQHMMTIGFTIYMQSHCERLRKRIDVFNRDGEVREAIKKLTDETPIGEVDLDLIFYAAKNGHADAAIIMEDYKRFGRSMNRTIGKREGEQ